MTPPSGSWGTPTRWGRPSAPSSASGRRSTGVIDLYNLLTLLQVCEGNLRCGQRLCARGHGGQGEEDEPGEILNSTLGGSCHVRYPGERLRHKESRSGSFRYFGVAGLRFGDSARYDRSFREERR